MSTAAGTRYTPEDLLAQENGYELIDGQLVEKTTGMEASAVAVAMLTLLANHVKAHGLGRVFDAECGYQIFPEEPNRVRKPDGSFVPRGLLPGERPVRGHCRIPPD